MCTKQHMQQSARSFSFHGMIMREQANYQGGNFDFENVIINFENAHAQIFVMGNGFEQQNV